MKSRYWFAAMAIVGIAASGQAIGQDAVPKAQQAPQIQAPPPPPPPVLPPGFDANDVADAQQKLMQILQGVRAGRFPLDLEDTVQWGGAGLLKAPAALLDQLDRKSGVLIGVVSPGTDAATAGLKTNDLLVKVNGKDIPSAPQQAHRDVLQALAPDQPVDLTIVRKGKESTLAKVKLPAATLREGLSGVTTLGGPAAVLQPFRIPGGQAGNLRPPGWPGVVQKQIVISKDVNGEKTNHRLDGKSITSTYEKGDVKITVTGTFDAGATKATEFSVTQGKETKTYKTLAEVPEALRPQAEQLLSPPLQTQIRGTSIRITPPKR